MKKYPSLPVVIVGGGPAGSATAIALSNLKIPCLVLDSASRALVKPGESLPPNANPVLQQLQLSHLLQVTNHAVYIGNTILWGTNEAQSRYFANESFGHGWHLDRLYFEQQLRQAAQERGAVWLSPWRLARAEQLDDSLVISCQDSEGNLKQIEACFGVDASGRASCLAKQFGVKKRILDQLTAFCAIVDQCSGLESGISYIESVAEGWWYAVPLPVNKVMVNFMTDVNLHQVNRSGLGEWLYKKMADTRFLWERLQIKNCNQFTSLQIKTASTSILDQPSGACWLAVGDALCTYDPLSSFGITSALTSGYHASMVINDYLIGRKSAINSYRFIYQQAFNNCMHMLQQQYHLEQRWKNYPFWNRRHLQ